MYVYIIGAIYVLWTLRAASDRLEKKNNKNVQCPRRQPPPPTDGNEPLDVNNCSTSV